MQRPPLFEANCFIYWKSRFETYVKSKDVDLWYIIAHGNYKPTTKDKDGKDVVTPYEKLDENQKKMLSKNDEAKMVLYNALPKKEYEGIFMCDTAQNVWDSLITTHQGNKQVKDNKIDLFVQKYKEFSIADDEIIDCAFSRFNTIITSLKALDESFSSRNHVRKFLRALPSKWRPKVTAIEESKDLSKLSLDELVGNLKVYEVVLEKDLEIAKNKKEKYKSLALKAKQVLSDDDTSSSDSNDEEYAMAEEKREDRRCFKCGDLNHFISDCPKNYSGEQKAFVVRSWSDSGDVSKKEEICLMGHSNEVLSDNLYYSSSSLDNESRGNEYDKLGQISLRIINKNKRLKAKNESLKKIVNELKTKLDILEKGKGTSSNCDACDELRLEVNSLKLKLASFEHSSSSLQKMIKMQKPSKDKCGLGYTETIASPKNTKIKNLGDHHKQLSVEPACRCP
ncbi:zf-CCHC domain-containing protein [Tanacetum coccineum]